mmetsp:Transcript_68764/g.174733  ORF Transcript_68764/g.174733 Transcript_68764/m.174733 type:complete len:354 (+) Transcript_68764:47-1108(+)
MLAHLAHSAMGQVGTLHAPDWTAADESSARALPDALMDKLRGLCYRVRKGVARNAEAIEYEVPSDSDDEDDESWRRPAWHSLMYHAEGIPESLDRLRVAAKFSINLEDGVGATSSVHRLVLAPPTLTTAALLPQSLRDVPPVAVRFSFHVVKLSPSKRLSRKAALGSPGLQRLALELRMDPDVLQRAGDRSSARGAAWGISCSAAFAASRAFARGIDAEVEGGLEPDPMRWWNEKEHSRQGATVALNPRVVDPSGPYAEDIEDGATVLDLRRCTNVAPRRRDGSRPWLAPLASRGSSAAVWALLAGGARSAPGPLRRLCACAELNEAIADFALESLHYEFEAVIHFALTLANF